MPTKVISKEYCRSCKEKTTQGLIVQCKNAVVRQCLECKSVRTYGKQQMPVEG